MACGTGESVLFIEVSLIQRCPYREVPLYIQSCIVLYSQPRCVVQYTLRRSRSVAFVQSLSSLILVTRGNLTDIPSAVCDVDLLNSAPVISHTGAACRVCVCVRKRRRGEGGREGGSQGGGGGGGGGGRESHKIHKLHKYMLTFGSLTTKSGMTVLFTRSQAGTFDGS